MSRATTLCLLQLMVKLIWTKLRTILNLPFHPQFVTTIILIHLCVQQAVYHLSFMTGNWNPAEFPKRMRDQIFHWLASMPVELEGYICQGCTILTIFIAMPQSMWEKLYQETSLYIRDLVNAPESLFLGRGNIFIYLSNMIVHLLEGCLYPFLENTWLMIHVMPYSMGSLCNLVKLMVILFTIRIMRCSEYV